MIERQSDAVVGQAVLRKIVGPNFFFAPAGANLSAPLRAVFRRFLLLLPFKQSRPQDRQCLFLVLELTATVLATNNRAGWNVHHLHCRVGGVHTLSARTAGAGNLNPQIFWL